MQLKLGINVGHGTSIDDITVPEQLRKRRFTGLKWFDDATGGLVPSTVMMLTGDPGAGKTTLALQVASALAEQGHIVLYNTGEESLFQVKMVAERLGNKGSFFVGNDVFVDDVLERANMLQARDPNADNNDGKQVFIIHDSLPTLDDGHYKNGTTSQTPYRCAERLTNWAKETFGIVIFINHVTKSGQFAGKQKLKHLIDGHARLYIEQDRRSDMFSERVFVLDKNRFGSSGSARVVGLNENGIYEKFIVQFKETDDEPEVEAERIARRTTRKDSGVFHVDLPKNDNEKLALTKRGVVKH